MSRIHRVSPEKVMRVIDLRTPLGLFLTKEGRKWVAVDNTTGAAACLWLRGKFEVG